MIEPTVSVRIDTFHYENTYRRLCPSENGKGKKDAPFATMWELFVWGAILGFINDKASEVERPYHTPPFKWQNIKDPHEKRLYIMAIEKMGTFDILQNPDELKKMIEKYSNGGMDLIHEALALDHYAYSSVESLIYDIQLRLNLQDSDNLSNI